MSFTSDDSIERCKILYWFSDINICTSQLHKELSISSLNKSIRICTEKKYTSVLELNLISAFAIKNIDF